MGITKKNLRFCAGKPLIAYTIEAARDATSINRVVVSTDDAEIAKVALGYGIDVIERPAEISDGLASSETALAHVLGHLKEHENYEPDLVVFLQCTSPIREPDDINKSVETLWADNADSLLSVAPSHRFLWRKKDSKAESVNYNYLKRSRRQDRLPEFVENGRQYSQ